jgi:predicted benzoate:H+ symporter BenE
VVVAVAGGVLVRLTDPEIVMLAGLSLLGVTTAAVTNAFAEAAARRRDEA